MTDKIAEESTEIITGMKVMTETGTGLDRGHFPEAITTIEIEVQAFLLLSSKTVGQEVNTKPKTNQYRTEEQSRYVYKKTESGSIINTDTLCQEIEQERQLNRIDDTNRETNPYKEFIVNNAKKIEPLLTQMKQWSILSIKLNYIQYDRHPKNYHGLGISTVKKCRKNPCMIEERNTLELDFGQTPDILWEEYLDVYEGIQSKKQK